MRKNEKKNLGRQNERKKDNEDRKTTRQTEGEKEAVETPANSACILNTLCSGKMERKACVDS